MSKQNKEYTDREIADRLAFALKWMICSLGDDTCFDCKPLCDKVIAEYEAKHGPVKVLDKSEWYPHDEEDGPELEPEDAPI